MQFQGLGTLSLPMGHYKKPRPLHLVIRIARSGSNLTALTVDGKNLRVQIDGAHMLEQSSRLLELIKPCSDDEREFRTIVRNLSKCLIHPIESAIDSCTELIVILPTTALSIPIDLLTYRRLPLCLNKPVSYRIGKTAEIPFLFQLPCSALIISDIGYTGHPGADPDRACLAIAPHLGRVTYQDSRDVMLEHLRQETFKDIILFSLHGQIGRGTSDAMQVADGNIRPADIAGLKPRLVYFDSCHLGISRAFINKCHAIGTAYYIAPVISNEAGSSSTKTMIKFFSHLLAGKSPEMALFLTRRSLWHLYQEFDVCKKWWMALAFRVYRLN
jgi:hypothetical protein